jgi:hypothetical protein
MVFAVNLASPDLIPLYIGLSVVVVIIRHLLTRGAERLENHIGAKGQAELSAMFREDDRAAIWAQVHAAPTTLLA